MAITFALSTQPVERVRADVLAVPMFAGGTPGPGADVVRAALGAGLAAFTAEAGFTGKPDETLVVPFGAGRTAAVLVGVGERGRVSTDQLRRAGGVGGTRRLEGARRWRRRCWTPRPRSTLRPPRRPSPKGSRSAPTASSPTSPTVSRRSCPG